MTMCSFLRTCLIAFAAMFLATSANAVDWTRVTGAQSQAGTGTSATLTITAVTSGDVVLGGLLLSPTSVVTSCTDNQSNAYRVTTGSIDAGGTLASFQFRSVGLITNGPTSITCNVTPSASTFWMIEDEFAPPTGTTAISLDGSQQLLNSGGASTANFQTLNSDDLIYAISMSNGTSTTGAGFTAGQGSGTGFTSEWKIQATASSSVNAVFATQTGSTWMTVVAISPVATTRWEFRQLVSQRTVTNATTGSASFPNALPLTLHLIVCTMAVDSGVTISSLVDDKSNNYVPNILTPNSNGRRVFWLAVSNGPKTITITVSASSSTVFFLCSDYAPPPNTTTIAVDGGGLVNTTTDTGATTTTPNITTTKNGDLAYGMCEPSAGGVAPANSFSMLNVQGATFGDAYLVQGTAGSINFGCTHADPTAINQSLVTFSATGANNAGPIRLPLLGVGG